MRRSGRMLRMLTTTYVARILIAHHNGYDAMTKQMNYAAARVYLLSKGISLRRIDDDELRVAYAGIGNEDSAYYTNNLADAIGTGEHMAAEKEKNNA